MRPMGIRAVISSLGVAECGGHIGVDEPRRDDVDGDAARRHLLREPGACEAHHAGLGGGVVGLAGHAVKGLTDPMKMIDPLRARTIDAKAARARKNAPSRFVASTSRHCSSDIRMARPSRVIPALATAHVYGTERGDRRS
jgi:hypothetical protein